MPWQRSGLTRGLVVVSVIAFVVIVGLFARPFADESTPWEFLVNAVAHTDSAGKVVALPFFAILLTGMNLIATLARLRLGLAIPTVVFAALALLNARVRRSWLVRVGFGLAVVAVVPLVSVGSDNPVGLGFLFAFLTPIAALLILSGTVLALTTKPADDTP